jgi:hypothetical protein
LKACASGGANPRGAEREDRNVKERTMMSTTVEINGRPVHPVANLFPMMTDEELADLATDIKANASSNQLSSIMKAF